MQRNFSTRTVVGGSAAAALGAQRTISPIAAMNVKLRIALFFPGTGEGSLRMM